MEAEREAAAGDDAEGGVRGFSAAAGGRLAVLDDEPAAALAGAEDLQTRPGRASGEIDADEHLGGEVHRRRRLVLAQGAP